MCRPPAGSKTLPMCSKHVLHTVGRSDPLLDLRGRKPDWPSPELSNSRVTSAPPARHSLLLLMTLLSPSLACKGSLEASTPDLLSILVTSMNPAAPCQILLTSPEYILTTELIISRDVDLTAKEGSVELQAAHGHRVLSVSTGSNVHLKGLSVAGGNTARDGGGIYNDGGNLTL